MIRFAAKVVALCVMAGPALAGPTCTDEPKTKWLTEEQMTAKFTALGYRDDVKKLHVSGGKCWEIYGHDKQGRKVEVYFHPISGDVVEAIVKP
jgi:hypothetical protein